MRKIVKFTLVAKIYRLASGVLAWLGEERDGHGLDHVMALRFLSSQTTYEKTVYTDLARSQVK